MSSISHRPDITPASQGATPQAQSLLRVATSHGRRLSLSTGSLQATKTDNVQKTAIRDVKKQLPPNTEKINTNDKKIEYLHTYISTAQKEQLKSSDKSNTLSPLVEKAVGDLQNLKAEKSIDYVDMAKREALKQAGLSDDEINEMMLAEHAELQKKDRPDQKHVFTPQRKESEPMAQVKEPKVKAEQTLADWQKIAAKESEKIDAQSLYDAKIDAKGVSQQARDAVVTSLRKDLAGAKESDDIKELLNKVKDGVATAREVRTLKDDIICARNIFQASIKK